MNEVKSSVDSLQRTMQESYLEILARVRGLEYQRPTSSSQDATTVTRTDIEEHSGRAHGLSIDSTAIQTSTSNSLRSFNRLFEKDLAVSRAYKRIQWRNSITSIFTNEIPETRWSTLSGPSVADVISELSVYELAITPSEIHQSQQYTPNAGHMIENAKELERSRRYLELGLSEPTAAIVDYAVLGTGVRTWNDAWLERYFYGIPYHGTILRDQVANASEYFERYRDEALSLTTHYVLRDVLRILGVARPHTDSLQAEKHTMFILYDEAIISQRRKASIQKLMPNDVPLRLIRDLQLSNRKPSITIQPKATELPTGENVDVTHVYLGIFVDGWWLHAELYKFRVRKSKHPLTYT